MKKFLIAFTILTSIIALNKHAYSEKVHGIAMHGTPKYASDFENLDYYTYEEFTREDFLREYDERFSPCCGADIYESGMLILHLWCKHCKEELL